MADFDDVVRDASPALVEAFWEVTEGKSWETAVVIPADLTGVTGECKALSEIDGTDVVTFSVAVDATDPDAGLVTITAEPPATDGVGGTSGRKRICPWYLTLTDGTRVAAAWGLQDARLVISQGE